MSLLNPTVEFKIVAVSSNRNHFGLRQHILIARDGTVLTGCANDLNTRPKNSVVYVPTTILGTYNLASLGFEIPNRLPDAPPNVVSQVWG